MLNTLTATDSNGTVVTKGIEAWATLRGVTVKYLRQRKRLGFSDEDAIHLPRGRSPKRVINEVKRDKLEPLWRKFLYNKRGGTHHAI